MASNRIVLFVIPQLVRSMTVSGDMYQQFIIASETKIMFYWHLAFLAKNVYLYKLCWGPVNHLQHAGQPSLWYWLLTITWQLMPRLVWKSFLHHSLETLERLETGEFSGLGLVTSPTTAKCPDWISAGLQTAVQNCRGGQSPHWTERVR